MIEKLGKTILPLLLFACHAAAGDAPTVWRPPYQELRQNEDWSILAGHDTSRTGDPFDPIKYIQLSDDALIWASFGGQLRLRSESYENFAFAPANDDTFILARLLLYADLHVGDYFRIFVEGKSALSTDRDLPGGRRPLDVDSADLQQAFADLILPLGKTSQLTLRPGRQALLFGRQRLVSPSDWTNTKRAWDGASLILETRHWDVTGFWTQFVPVRKHDFNEPDAQDEFYGLYAVGSVPATDIGLDLYWLRRELDDLSDRRHTIGARLFGDVARTGFAYDLEAAWQAGDSADLDVRAYMLAAELSYRLDDIETAPRLWIGVEFASGDDDPADGDLETFSPLFAFGHPYFGYIDLIGRQNILDLHTGFSLSPTRKLTALAALHFFWRAEEEDALYNPAGGVVRPPAGVSSLHVGSEIDLLLQYQFDRHLAVHVGYGHFFAGRFIERATPAADEDIDFLYISLEYTF